MSLDNDQRTRIRTKGGYNLPYSGPGVALRTTNGLMFPLTPTINLSQSVEYAPYEVVHTNYQQNAYTKTKNPSISVTGTFTSTTPKEAMYTIGVIHFLRVVTKMNFGRSDNQAGTPPPVLEFYSYGRYNFHKVPVLVSDFTVPYENTTDYIEVIVAGEPVQLPIVMNISVTLLPHYHPRLQDRFNLASFANGDLYRDGFI